MIVKLLPAQITKHWDIIKFGVERSVPPIAGETPDKINNILRSLIEESMQCWASVQVKDDKTLIEGIVLTTVVMDGITGTKSLLVYSIYSFSNESNDMSWIEANKKFLLYAKGRGCDFVIGYTSNKNIIKFIKRMGGDVTAFIRIPVEI